ncbi:methylated-DNA--[protein]-cysteine S-methyltransferase [Patescibacteria group bacterium]|uniref:Methylated-DNA--[protein]-cysteine S-methyltransferase n=1 Tax=candidate division WWE3 bacterium TaxID=2053526 RepID=A0A928TRT0_UNCKA|nr:methylated-DNA--[protein]-cysteine S-methyltransferase [candidate division WWE3 bacterium]MCL4733031.1 methylated-DNA--[protein]-cysteine S-methyltransferase [Patescibacteria group bacterium]MDL1953303.1 methylated-DNA--[protein]-cysteine S-methyltransferase [Candidatus Uhrbacteria bacterium UHB]RIL00532.1 MAG: hypothetical protein DCC77_03150 [Candidatus Uhrbacteria bacterium]
MNVGPASTCMTNTEIVFRIVSHIPMGCVLTYADVARLAGMKSPRVIGNILHTNQDPVAVPCHRIVNASGRVSDAYSMGGAKIQQTRLRDEGVRMHGLRANLAQRWKPSKEYASYLRLLRRFGDPGPWPWFGKDRPHTPDEIAIGAILTQNTSWRNVEQALVNLRREGVETLSAIPRFSERRLQELIRPSGFFNQKADRLKRFAAWIDREYSSLEHFLQLPVLRARAELLSFKGIGRETADTILLYCGTNPIFVIDAYAKRFSTALNLSPETAYESLQTHFMDRLPTHLGLFREYHALIIAWGQSEK